MIDTRHAATQPRYLRRQRKRAKQLREVRFRWGSDSKSLKAQKHNAQTLKEEYSR